MTNPRVYIVVAALVGLLAGLAFGGLGGDSDEPGPEPSGASGDAREELAALQQQLDAERSERLALATRVEQLQWVVEQLVPTDDPDASFPRVDEPPPAAEDEPQAAPAQGLAALMAPRKAGFDESEFLARGYQPDEIEALKERYDASKMEELYLRDVASREGWGRKPRLKNEMQKVRRELRDEVGEDAYDVMLFATGQSNRIRLLNTLSTSPAEAAGLQEGDVIVSYAGEKIYTVADLQQSTRSGEAGEAIALEILREGESVRIYVPRGPLGARLLPHRIQPDSGY